MSEALSTTAHSTLEGCEAEMRQCRDTMRRDFRRFGMLLQWLRDMKLYLQRDPSLTFDAYCRQEWDFSDSRARQIILASQAVEISVTDVTQISTASNEWQTRKLLQESRIEREDERDWNRVMFNPSDDDIGDKKCSGEWDDEDETDRDSPEYQFGSDYGAAWAARKAGFDVALPDPTTYGLPEDTEIDRLEFGGETPVAVVKPHVAYNSGNNEWYTPREIVEPARTLMGGFDFDPASTATANEVVQAAVYFSAEDDGLAKQWRGRVWMNPPYSADLVSKFTSKLCQHFTAGEVTEAIVLVNNATETRWFKEMAVLSSAICFPTGRVRFWSPIREAAAPLQGQALLYFGGQVREFRAAFANFGFIATL